ncbi:MAG: hypothetical protein Q9219_002004 [cf. Caloplaca sp. 3 TL-2023]
MAAQSRLALRSSHRGGVGLGELPTTVIQRNHSPTNTRKRICDPSSDQADRKPSKRLQDDGKFTTAHRNAKIYSRKPSTSNVAAPGVVDTLTQINAVGPHTPPPQSSVVQQPPHNPTTTIVVQDEHSSSPILGNHESLVVDNADKRNLRSHDGGSRFKSELESYFADYNEVLVDQPKAQGINQCILQASKASNIPLGLLTPTTRVYFVDEPVEASVADARPRNTPSRRDLRIQFPPIGNRPTSNADSLVIGGQKSDMLEFNNAERLDFTSAEPHTRQIVDDPLPDELYIKAHRRAQRGEKSHRNREKESAQHEKFQLERILDGLKGHTWLKTMGISGITDSEKQLYEPKRMLFIQRVTALLNKFRAWKEEEKRRKLMREQASNLDDEAVETTSESDQSDFARRLDGIDERSRRSRTKRYKRRDASPTDIGQFVSSRRARRQPTELLPLPAEKPFTSFYSKPYLRDAALSKHRRGRLRFAFGQQVPDLVEREFTLPPEILTTKFIAANARSRRAARREGKDN